MFRSRSPATSGSDGKPFKMFRANLHGNRAVAAESRFPRVPPHPLGGSILGVSLEESGDLRLAEPFLRSILGVSLEESCELGLRRKK